MENKNENLIQKFLPPVPEMLLSLAVIIIAWKALSAGGGVWFIFLAICAFGGLLECFSLYMTKEELKEQDSMKTKFELGLWCFYMIFAFYGFWALREESFEMVFRFLLLIVVSDIGAYFARKLANAESFSVSEKIKGNIFYGAILAGLVDSLYSLHWVGLFSGALLGAMAQFGKLFVLLLKDKAKVENSNILFPWQSGILDKIGCCLFIGLVFGTTESGLFSSEEDYYND